MEEENFGSGVMPESESAQAEQAAQAIQGGRQPDFRVVQPEYDIREGKTVFHDVGAIWRNVSQKTGKEFYSLKIGKLRLLVFENRKLEQ
ncbi:MAG: hypothetical protein V1822_03495 [Candidatus Micrarchaeota archaeon]